MLSSILKNVKTRHLIIAGALLVFGYEQYARKHRFDNMKENAIDLSKPEDIGQDSVGIWLENSDGSYDIHKISRAEYERANQGYSDDFADYTNDVEKAYHENKAELIPSSTAEIKTPSATQTKLLAKRPADATKITLYSYQVMAQNLYPEIGTNPLYNKSEFKNNMCIRTQLLHKGPVSGIDLKFQKKVRESCEFLEKYERTHTKDQTRMKVLEKFAEVIEHFERRDYTAYKDVNGYMTVGMGFNMDAKEAKKIYEASGIKKDFDTVKSGKISLTDEDVNKLYAATMMTNITKSNGQTGFSMYNQLINHVRNACDGEKSMEEIPYHAQMGLLIIMYNSPETINGNKDIVYDYIRKVSSSEPSDNEIKEAGTKVGNAYMEYIASRGGINNKNIFPRAQFATNMLIGAENNPTMDKDTYMTCLEKCVKEHGNATGKVIINQVGATPEGFKPDDLRDLKNETDKTIIYIDALNNAVHEYNPKVSNEVKTTVATKKVALANSALTPART